MTDPFESSRRKIARAQEHFENLQRQLWKFSELCPYKQVTEPHPDKAGYVVHKIILTQGLPDSIGDTVSDMVQNLRNALDNAGYSVAVAAGSTDPKFSAFPFAGSIEQMKNSLGRSKDVPEQIQSLFCGFQPYLGGDDLLWALNEMCIADKHKMVIPVGQGQIRASAAVQGTGYFNMPDPHVWDRTKNEMVLITLGPGAKFQYHFDFRLFVAFNEIKVVDGQPILGVLHELGSKVQSIIVAIEAESRRLGFVK